MILILLALCDYNLRTVLSQVAVMTGGAEDDSKDEPKPQEEAKAEDTKTQIDTTGVVPASSDQEMATDAAEAELQQQQEFYRAIES